MVSLSLGYRTTYCSVLFLFLVYAVMVHFDTASLVLDLLEAWKGVLDNTVTILLQGW